MAAPDVREFVIERILGDKMVNGTRFFLIGWEGFGPEENTWEPESGLGNAKRLISRYLANKRAKPGSGRQTAKSPATPRSPGRPTLESRRQLEQEFAASDERIIFVRKPPGADSIERVTSVAIAGNEFLFSVVLRNGETKKASKAEIREAAPAEFLEFLEFIEFIEVLVAPQ
jgi:hypothetical protein